MACCRNHPSRSFQMPRNEGSQNMKPLLGSWSAMHETKPCRIRERPAKECQDFCERAVCVSELENWQCEVPEAFTCR